MSACLLFSASLLALDSLEGELDIVGIVVNDTEVGSATVYRSKGQFWLALPEITAILGFEYNSTEDRFTLQTPIGAAEIQDTFLAQRDGQVFISQEAFPTQLATAFAFNAAEYSLQFTPPMAIAGSGPDREVIPDIAAPNWSLSRLDAEAGYLYRDQQNLDYLTAELGGAAAGGQWEGRVLRDTLGDLTIENYVWMQRSESTVWAVGNRQVALHPLLPAFEFTGAAVSYSPRINSLFETVGSSRQLSRSDQSAVRDFDGAGPPGGIAELRVDQVVIQRARIGLDGLYEFRNVPLRARGYQHIEVHLYERAGGVAVRVDDYSQTVSQVVLPGGSLFVSAGAGVSGNPLSGERSGQDRDVSFLTQLRYGISDRVTGEVMLQRDGTQVQMLTGLALQVTDHWNAAAAIAGSGDGEGYHFETNGFGQDWRFRAYAVNREAGLGRDAGRVLRQQADFNWRFGSSLDVGLRGRAEEIDNIERSYIKPTLAWFAGRSFSLRSYPDVNGDYRHDVQFRPQADWRLAWSRTASSDLFDVSHRLKSNWRTRFTHQSGPRVSDRQVASITRYARMPWGTTIEAGFSRTSGKLGYFVDALFSVGMGLRARLEIRDEPVLTGLDFAPKELTAQLSLFGDFTVAGRRFVPARSSAIAAGRGAIAGRLMVEDIADQQWDLEQTGILVDGAPRGNLGPGGTFFVDQLSEGVHRVAINEESLPIELQDTQGTLLVEVRGGAVTRMDFHLAAFFGIAGQIIDDTGAPLAGVVLVVVDAAGQESARSQSDEYGLYRIDGLPPGAYTVKAQSGSGIASLEIDQLSEFLFDQDLIVSQP